MQRDHVPITMADDRRALEMARAAAEKYLPALASCFNDKAEVKAGEWEFLGDWYAVIDKGGHALDPRGEFHTEDSIRERLAMRNLMDELRSAGVDTGGPSSFSSSDRQAFANQLDRFLTRYSTP